MEDWVEFKAFLESKRLQEGIRPLFFVESGAKLYGFEDEDSDVDVRGVVIKPLEKKLTLGTGLQTLEGEFGEIDYDLHELEKFMGLLYKGNFNVIEWVFSPHTFDEISSISDSNYVRLKSLAERSIHYRTGNHVRGWSKSIYKMNWNIPKKCLYALRPMMVYIYFCKTGIVESDIRVLANTPEFKEMEKHIMKLIELKKQGKSVNERLKKRNKDFYRHLRTRTKEVEEMLEREDTQRLKYDRDFLEDEINMFLNDLYKEE